MLDDLINLERLRNYTDMLRKRLAVLMRSTAYTLGSIVQWEGKFLECEIAGTTGLNLVSLDGKNPGDKITDGTVTWLVIDPFSTGIKDWQASTKYLVGNFVIKNDVLYECITANTDATFNSEKWKAISKDGLSAWESSKQYPLYATVVENEEVYFCIVAHTSSNTFKDDLDAHKWKLIGGGSSSGGNWEQVTKLNVVAPLNVDIPIPYTDTFNRPPVEVLKYTQGNKNITTNALTFSAGDGSKFEIAGVTAKDSQLVTFDGVVKPNHDITYPFNTPTLMTTKYYSESKEIDLSDYKVVEEVSLE